MPTVQKKRIKVTVKSDGSILVAPEGHAGAKCKDATSALEKALGMTTKTNRTVEWALKEAEVCKVNQKK